MEIKSSSTNCSNTNPPFFDNSNNFQGDQTAILQQKIQRYVDEKKKLYDYLLIFLENSENLEKNFQNLIDQVNNHQEIENRENFEHFLHLITEISNNFHRDDSFFKKIFQILNYYQDQIKGTFSNIEIFNIFQSNKPILLFLFDNKVITIDDQIYLELINKREKNGNRYCHFFYPEIKEYAGEQKVQSIKEELLTKNPKIFNKFDEKRKNSTNDSYLSSLIRQDSIELFISHISKNNISLSSQINHSIFETNRFLIKNKLTLIEYSAFYGAIQIFQYLISHDIKLTPSLWFYVIHSQNSELIQILESKGIKPPILISEEEKVEELTNDDFYIDCFIESIKCHHNEIAQYINDNLMSFDYNKIPSLKKREKIISKILQYHNYEFFPSDFVQGYEFYYLYYNNYNTLSNLFIKKEEKEIQKKINENKNKNKNKNNDVDVDVIYYSLLKLDKIEDDRFNGNKKLHKIAIPSSIESIGNNAFNDCSEMTSIAIPSTLKSIGKRSFFKCSNLRRIKIPTSVQFIGDEAFSYCTYLTTVKIPNSIKSIEKGVFLECIFLEKIIIPTSVTSIGDNAFSGCSNLEELFIPSTVTSIGDNAFNSCHELKKISIPLSITKIGKGCFMNCSSITEIEIPSSITEIEDNVFESCKLLKKISIPNSITLIGNFAFDSCESLKNLKIPSSVTKIGDNALSRCSSLTEIEIPSSVKSIGKYCFYDCQSITKISIETPSSLAKIEDFGFRSCSSLTDIEIPSSVKSIGCCSFSDCSSLTEISIPSSVINIDDYAFSCCSSLKEISIPSSVKSLKNGVFTDCSSLTKISIPSSVESIGCCCFYKCSSLIEISIPDSIKSIESGLFYGCSSLKELKIPSSVEKIGLLSFFGCSSLSDISYQKSSLNEIGSFAFYGCSSLMKNLGLTKKTEPMVVNIDDFEIKDLIGIGGFSCAFRAVDKKTGNTFCLKQYDERDFRGRNDFLRKIAISSIPGVVKIKGYRFPLTEEERNEVKTLQIQVKVKDREIQRDLTGYILLLELMENGNAADITKEYLKDHKTVANKMNPTIRSKIIFGVASIMKQIHQNNVFNRDLKLNKVLLDENFEPKIDCFGLTDFLAPPNRVEMAIGTPLYMAPEIFMDGYDYYNLSIDVYSYGILLYHMFTSEFAFDGVGQIRSAQQFMINISRGRRPKRVENIPDHYWELIQKCWQQNLNNRPTFEQITTMLKDDKFALEEFGMKTDLEQLHEYQKRIDTD